MLVFDFGKYILDIDVNKTREFYGQAKALTDRCDCQGCKNYAAWAEGLSPETKDRLETVGLSLEKAQEVYVKCRFPDGTLSYGGWYHLCGRILQGPDPWVRVDDRSRYLARECFVYMGEDYRVTFTEDISLLDEEFPMPVIQMEIEAKLPFTLPEDCEYGICNYQW